MKDHNNSQVYYECGDGWKGIIDPLVAEITRLGGRVDRVKEKNGGLRVYFAPASSKASEEEWDAFEDVLALAQAEAERTCEMCGKPGRMMRRGEWHKTLCDEHKLELSYQET